MSGAEKKQRELVVGSSSHNKGLWSVDLCYQGLGERVAMFWFELSVDEARELAAELIGAATAVEARNAKLLEGGAA